MKDDAGAPEADRFDEAPHPRETLAFFGHAAAERDLLDAYRANRMAQAWIIGGPEGVGKATLAWRMARFLLANPNPESEAVQSAVNLTVAADHPVARRLATLAVPDIFLLRREWNDKTKKHFTEIRVEDVRKIISSFHQASSVGGWRIAIIDCADDLNRASANALLKLIEEPPERSLFLLVAHQPGRVLPTIRSRCRRLALAPLTDAEVVSAIQALLGRQGETTAAKVAAAAARAEGSVREALRLLQADTLTFDAAMAKLFESLPNMDWLGAHALADKLTGRDNASAYESFLRAIERYMDSRVRALAASGAPMSRLVGYARAWEDIHRAALETDVFNFDKKALALTIFERLAEAEGRG